ncbi:uncharacterized protein An13g03480 [Aspergillus niger]|uniref:Contig An13c0100, genomic contig n=2 Tax=Aspergillus niger TaxID=5061 RepID=A2R244_ASPNC|nr:uncharacterized protein An13g03480 [Aspergillus niger]CAK41744.1 unnamed protein product [Aspergillus niger]
MIRLIRGSCRFLPTRYYTKIEAFNFVKFLVGDRRLIEIAHPDSGEAAHRLATADQPGILGQLIATHFVLSNSALRLKHPVRAYSGLRDREGCNDIDPSVNVQQLSCKPHVQPFVGRIGGNQGIVLDRADPDNAEYLRKVPDAAPLMSARDAFNVRGFTDLDLWRFAVVECVAFITAWAAATPANVAPPTPSTPAGIFATTAFLGPLVGAVTNWLLLTLFIFSFSSVSGSHLNPTITLATFFARLISLPRMVLYLCGQILGGALAGWILQSAFGSGQYSVGGCVVDTALVPVREAFVLEFICSLTLIFLSFGVGLDPRQVRVYGAALSPWLVGMVLGARYTSAKNPSDSASTWIKCFRAPFDGRQVANTAYIMDRQSSSIDIPESSARQVDGCRSMNMVSSTHISTLNGSGRTCDSMAASRWTYHSNNVCAIREWRIRLLIMTRKQCACGGHRSCRTGRRDRAGIKKSDEKIENNNYCKK